ncbi:hypothetical protein [Sphingobacterium faecium]|uniref:hypothetical protein n=1 Tax=Sphingobacterium faecium TaxID=34087 RepID=UPI0032084835
MDKLFFSAVMATFLSTSILHAQTKNEVDKPLVQNPPITMEALVGNRGVMYQLIVNKKFQSIPKLGFFSVTNATAAWEKEMTPDIMTQSHLTYSLFKGLDVTSGMQYTPVYGFRPVAGLIYSYNSKDLLLIVNPKVDLADDLATETMAIVEYKPKIKEKLNFYSRVQGLYGFVPDSGIHNRSYLMLRAGLSYREFTFGAASNFDWYGPMKHNENNFGIFVSALLF